MHVADVAVQDTLLLLSPMVQDLLRMVDRVTVKGSIKPMELYTFDVPVRFAVPCSRSDLHAPWS